MAEETTPTTSSLDEQLDRILHPLSVRREVATLDEQLDRILRPLSVCKETPPETADQPANTKEDGMERIHLYFFSALCEWADADPLRTRLRQLLASTELDSASILPMISQHQRCYFMIVATSPFPPSLFEQLRTLKEIHDSFDFTTALDLETESDGDEGEAFGV